MTNNKPNELLNFDAIKNDFENEIVLSDSTCLIKYSTDNESEPRDGSTPLPSSRVVLDPIKSNLGTAFSFMSLLSTRGMKHPRKSEGSLPNGGNNLDLDSYPQFNYKLQSGEINIPLELSEETDYVVKLVENILTFLRLLSKAKDKEDYVLAIAVFAQCRSDRSLTSLLLSKWNDLMTLSLQSGGALDSLKQLKDILSKYETIKKLPIFTKLYKFLLYCIGTSLFEKMGIKFDAKKFLNIETAIIKKEYHLGPDFIHCILDTVVYICETGYQCMVTGSIDPIFHHESTYDQWIQEGELLRTQSKYITNPEPHGFTVFDFLSRLDNNIEKGKAIARFIPKSDTSSLIIRRLLSELESIKADCKTKRLAQQERKAPFAVLVHGGSSVAKSQFTKLLFYHYGKLFNLPIDDEFKYTRNAFDQYWTNFNSSQWCLQLDDIAYLHPNKASECDPSLVEMLQVVNNVPYVPTQADLADKGKTPVRARFVIATTNTESLNAETYFACPLAVQRRLPYVITIEPKKQFCKDDGPMIDPTKIPESSPGEYPDLWKITVKRVVPSENKTRKNVHMGQTADLKIEGIYEDIYTFLEWFNGVARHAEGTQEKAMKCDTDMKSVTLCNHGLPKSKCVPCCSELSLQSGEMIPYVETEWTREVHRRLMQRQEEEEVEELPPGYQYTVRCVLECISSMSLMTRCIVFWYYLVFAFMARFPRWGPPIVAFFYGRWYFFIIACRLLHIPQMRHICCYLIGYRAYRAVRSPKAVIFCASIVTAVTLLKTGKMLLSFSGLFDNNKCDEDVPMYMCADARCRKCTVCLERNALYSSGKPMPWYPENIMKAVEENHKFMCNETCQRCPKLQGVAAERGITPEPHNDKKENVWYKDHFECTTFDTTPASLSKNNWTLDEAVKHVSGNCAAYIARVRTEDEIKETIGKTVCIGGHTYIMNNHCLPHDTFELSLIFQSGKDGVTTNFTTLVTPGQIKRVPNRDLLFLQLPSIPPKKDIRDLFAKKSFEGRFDGEYISRSLDGSLMRRAVIAPKLNREFHFSEEIKNVEINAAVWTAKVKEDTANGDCGSILLVKTAMGPMVLGIHVLGGIYNNCVALSVDYETLMDLDVEIFSDNVPSLQVGDYKQELVDLSKKATVRFIEEGTMIVYGSLSGFRGKLRSRVIKTYMSDLAVRDGYSRNTGPPVMNSWIPWRRALLDMARPVSHIDLTLLQHCVDSFTVDILSALSSHDLKELKVYTLNVALNGCPGLAYVDKMPRNTSAGFPFRKSKKYFLEAIPAFGEYQHPVQVSKDIELEMDKIIELYENNQVYCPVFTASLKDEPTSLQKIADGKTRVFCGAPLPWSLVVRMYLLPVIRLIQKNRFIFEAGPGTIAQSTEWDEIYHYITQFGKDRIVAGDYGKFDKRMPASVILSAFQIIKNILNRAGWSARDLRVVSGIAEDTAFPTIDFHGELIRCYGTNPSGHPLTVIINGLANSLYVRYCYAYNHPNRSCDNFKENISLFTYGDDMIMGVNRECTWLDHTIMQKTLANIDIEFTMAEKTAKSVPFIHIDEATFLRRRWRFEPQLNCMVCPIEHDSIDKMLTMCVESKTICKQLQAVAVLETACREYFWYGEEIFHQKRALFYRWIEELDLFAYLERSLPTWEQLKNEFLENSNLRNNSCPGPRSAQPETTQQVLTQDLLERGLTSRVSVNKVFKNSEHAEDGLCQSKALELDLEQRVVSSEPHERVDHYIDTPIPSSMPPVYDNGKDETDEDVETQFQLILQSGENVTSIGDLANSGAEITETAVASFLDEVPGESWKIPSSVTTNLSDMQPQIELAQYLSRPVLLTSLVWSQTDNYDVGSVIQPWHLFFNNTAIKNKINNYTFIHCKLKVKFVINASPFLYGAMAMAYTPLKGYTGENIASTANEIFLWSQRPKVWIYPQTCQGGELELPFFYHKNWLDITDAQTLRNMGDINPCIYANLASSNGLTGQSVVINVYAWAEDVKLHAPTTKLAVQSDEFEYKPSQIASAVAGASGSLSKIPYIGPYMKATSVVSKGVANIASALGFTNVPNMDTVATMKTQPFPHNSTCEVSVPIDRASVDPKNEVTIDPRTVGLDGKDELDISYICGRETYLGNAILSTTDSVNALTLVSRVTPMLSLTEGATGPILFTPMAYLGTHFAAWRGDIIFRFRFVCSRFHKGRVRITWDPTNNISTSVPDYTTVFNEVVDIGADQDIEVRVPYSQATTYLPIEFSPGVDNYNLSGTGLAPTGYSNGLITMRVVNPLSAPTATQAIPVMVFVRAADNFEFAHPLARFAQNQVFSPYALQSGEITYTTGARSLIAGNAVGGSDPNRNLVHYGESIKSLRPLIHRLEWQYTVRSPDLTTAPTVSSINFLSTRAIKYPGYVSNGIWSANKTIAPISAVPYNYVRGTFLQLVSLLFIGQRGSMTYSYSLETNTTKPPSVFQVKRHNTTINTSEYSLLTTTTSGTGSGVADFILRNVGNPGSGVALTNMNNQPALSMNFPYYSRFNFQFVDPRNANLGSSEDGSNLDCISAHVVLEKLDQAGTIRANVWAACGPDYNFFFFKNVPSMYIFTAPNAP